ncbi:MAG: hypothetical protein IIY87_03215 [Bacteroidales bacterium]|nr:hypothetical protein [Bacteroidales bacterium]
MQIDTIWRNCTNEELLEVLADCPEVVEELKKIGYKDLVNSYDALLPRYNMDRVTAPVHKDNSDEIECFSYWYRIDSQEYNADIAFNTKAEAQLASVKDTMQELRNRILATK